MNLSKPPADRETVDLYKARARESLPWIVSPLKGLQGGKFKAFHVRHEASLIELFFDLFFVANLATFTAVHEITNGATARAYIGFFVLLWSTWFQITIFDVRFAQDSVYERFCKLYQFMVFVVLAAVGANFNPADTDAGANYRIYKALTTILGITRIILAIQYLVVALFVVPKHRKVLLPFVLIIGVFLLSGTILLALTPFFNESGVNRTSIGWWILLPIEAIAVITISSFWRMLSFKESHLNERLSLLTIIIIGEGVIGVTKGVGKMWPTDSMPAAGVIIEVLSIVALLFTLWQAYFDNHPHGHYGTIKQQWWAVGHFFLHLGYVGVVEGSNQMAIYFYALKKLTDLQDKMIALCKKQVTNDEFVTALSSSFDTAKVEKYDTFSYNIVQQIFQNITNNQVSRQDLCASDADESTFWDLFGYMGRAYMAKYGIEPAENNGYAHTFKTTYVYYWASVALTFLTLLGFLFVVRGRYKRDVFEIIRMVWRLVMIVVSIGLIFVYLSETAFDNYITGPTVVLTVVIIMTLTLTIDRICRLFGTRRFRQNFQIPLQDHAHDVNRPDVYEGHYSGFESREATLLSHLGPLGTDTRPTHMRNLSSQSDSSQPEFADSYTSIDPGSHVDGVRTGMRLANGNNSQTASAENGLLGNGRNLRSHVDATPIAGPYESLRNISY